MIILHRKFPPGGVVGQFLRKCSSKDNDVEWANIPSGSSLPDGGTTGQALRKASNADQDVSWQNDPDPFPPNPQNQQVLTKIATGLAWQDVPKELPTGGSTGQVLTKTASGQQWQNVPTELPTGGSSGQILQKTSSGVGWRNAPREVPTGGSSGYFLKKIGNGDNDYQWQYQSIPSIPTHYNQTAFSDWSGYNISNTSSLYNIYTSLYKEGGYYGSAYAYQQCEECYNSNLTLILKLRLNGNYILTPVSILRINNTWSRISLLYPGVGIKNLDCTTSGVQMLS